MKKLLSILLASLLVVGILGACSKQETSDKKKVLVMGTSADYKPYEYIDSAKSDEIIGFDVDIAKYIAKELGYEIKIKDMDFTGLLAAMEAKKVDFVMAGMTPTAERKKNADFTDIYFTAKNLVISKDGAVQKVEDLKGKTVGVQTGSIQEGKAKDIQKATEIKITDRNRIPELFEELKAGRVDAIIIEDTVAKGYLAKMSELKSIEIPEAADEAGSAIAFPKGSKQTEEFNKVIKKMQDNGEMEKLIKKWFGDEQ
ncbi:transporter substrate-binding domain-containing protein [Ectobacillus antri]|jgi:ABC-type amino acid transport substrate-binding protein|uniref:Transporter substrate-binding domain-containing protein n=1 Tax=Ectobacillus antri TaxID=2486280 RepID=A0ABT6H255_9BACI|nr:transporter substrate-binding domain-containing protein [Ectobacillus antri]MDG4655634.1 transporter substrate-binding domain-containing protein [Ectobacillus antri]MDG5753392.1 transporter substrate-binding domain-containing protein [Ectobacillus antri]